MRANDPGWETTRDGSNGSWRVGAAVEGGWVKKPGSWGTPFSGFRFTVPELCGFEGRAIYFDADMLLLADIAELWGMAPREGTGMRCINQMRSDVSVIDCSWFKGRAGWPSIAEMKPSGRLCYHYMQWLIANRALDLTLPKEWNDCDGAIYNQNPASVKLLHYTNVPVGQPYRPYPNVDYPKDWPYIRTSHTAGKLWWQEYQEALWMRDGYESAQQKMAAAGGVWQ